MASAAHKIEKASIEFGFWLIFFCMLFCLLKTTKNPKQTLIDSNSEPQLVARKFFND